MSGDKKKLGRLTFQQCYSLEKIQCPGKKYLEVHFHCYFLFQMFSFFGAVKGR